MQMQKENIQFEKEKQHQQPTTNNQPTHNHKTLFHNF